MQIAQGSAILLENFMLPSVHLDRLVRIDLYFPENISALKSLRLLLINDGQDLSKFDFLNMLDTLQSHQGIEPLLCVGIHCGKERKMEYGTISYVDFKGRGIKAAQHRNFVLKELIPFLKKRFKSLEFTDKAYAGFSLGGLSALDITWHHPDEFNIAGVFSGSFWWRLRALDNGYIEETDRIMHKLIRESNFKPGLKFYFMTGSKDEMMDRNNNGIIDSIDDTLGLIEELVEKGYERGKDIHYINYEEGRHDVKSWGKAMPDFLKWGWGRGRVESREAKGKRQ